MHSVSQKEPGGDGQSAGLLVGTDWLTAKLDSPDIRVVDCRFYFDDPNRGRRAYEESHIPGAVYLNWTTDISQPRGNLQFMAASAEQLKGTLERLGISDNTTVVGYDDEGGHYVARLWLVARRYGFDNVRMLEGGWTKWLHEGRATRAGTETPHAPGQVTVRDARPELLTDAEGVLQALEDPNAVVLDVRRWTEYTGEEARSKHGGRVPGARWMLWQDNLNWEGDRDFRPEVALRERYEAAGVTPDQTVVTYCHGGVRAGHTAFTLAVLGYPNVRVYDGSWEEWGSRDDLPIATGFPSPEETVP